MNETINSQMDAIKQHLKKYKTITSLQAIERYGCTRLSGYIWRLRQQGYKIDSIRKVGLNRYDNYSHWAEYNLIEEPKEITDVQ